MAADIIQFLLVRDVKAPSRAHAYDAGIDFYVPKFTPSFLADLREKNPFIFIENDSQIISLSPGQKILIPSGVHCKMANPGRALIAANKSGVASKHGLIFGAQVVDFEYQGEIHLNLINVSDISVNIFPDMKILQFLEMPIFNSKIIVDEVNSVKVFYSDEVTTRGAGGFGSTDDKSTNDK